MTHSHSPLDLYLLSKAIHYNPDQSMDSALTMTDLSVNQQDEELYPPENDSKLHIQTFKPIETTSECSTLDRPKRVSWNESVTVLCYDAQARLVHRPRFSLDKFKRWLKIHPL